ncbi:uncharacterized protein LOC129748986 [Uranotaenia lowii]|uniref:uncharacterized protein LOC129748986 n=1 Tax=Uranotaenia lowii TaxID=190385 RepID=UPI00247ADDB2|nr:uncharacterized protein LOC129748986 [Uranotaenia lowii]
MNSSSNNRPPKLCKRTYFLKGESIPTQSQMRSEIGKELAEAILEFMSPACQAWMGFDRKLLGPDVYCTDMGDLKAKLHEHILAIGQDAEEQLEINRRMAEKKPDCREEFEFLQFECRQKIEIAREEEQRLMELQLEAAKLSLEEKYLMMKIQLGEDYLQARKEMSRFICRNLRQEAKVLLTNIARQFRIELEQEVSRRVNDEVDRMNDQIEEVVTSAVEHQKAVDTQAMLKMCYRYEQLMKNVQQRENCRQLTELAQYICSQWAELRKGPEKAEVPCQTSFVIRPESEEESIAESEFFEGESEFVDADDIFVVEGCQMKPGPSPVYSFADTTVDEEPEESTSLEAFEFNGRTYAQPKYYHKIQDELFPVPFIQWEPRETLWDDLGSLTEELLPVDSDFVREIVGGIMEENSAFNVEDLLTETVPTVSEERYSSTSSEYSANELQLFDLEKSEGSLELLVNGIALKYIKTSDRDYERFKAIARTPAPPVEPPCIPETVIELEDFQERIIVDLMEFVDLPSSGAEPRTESESSSSNEGATITEIVDDVRRSTARSQKLSLNQIEPKLSEQIMPQLSVDIISKRSDGRTSKSSVDKNDQVLKTLEDVDLNEEQVMERTSLSRKSGSQLDPMDPPLID